MGGTRVDYKPAIAAGVSTQVHLLLNRGGAPQDEIRFTRTALGQWLVGMCHTAEVGAMAAQLRGPDDGTIGVAYDAAADAYGDAPTGEGDVVSDVPPRVAVAWCYLATANIVKTICKRARRTSQAAEITHTLGGGEESPLPGMTLPGGASLPGPVDTTSIPPLGLPPLSIPGWPAMPELPEDVPPIVLPGPFGRMGFGAPGDAMAFSVPAGVLALIGFAFAATAAAYVARDALVASEVEMTKRRDIEVAAQVKVATEVCAANAAIGQPCDVPDVVRKLAKEEKRSSVFWSIGAPVIGASVLGVGGFMFARKKGLL